MTKRNGLGVAKLSLLGCAAIHTASYAQTGTSQPAASNSPTSMENDSSQVGDIIVTAQKREQSINKVPLTIQAATSETLAARGILNPSDLSKIVPGFSATQSIYATPVYVLRGVGLYDATFAAVPAVAVYTDQIPRNFPVMSDALDLDLERVEVLKGPQGTLFGQSATGGAVNYITAKPTNYFKAGISTTYERFGRLDTSGFISGPINDTLSARIAVGTVGGGAWQYSATRPKDTNGESRLLKGRLTLDWKPTDKLSIEISATGVRDRSDVQAGQFAGSVFNTYSAQALAIANANPATRNPYGVVDNARYASLTTPTSPGFDSTFLGRQSVLIARLNSTDPTAAAGVRSLLGAAEPGNARGANWSVGSLTPSHNSYYQATGRLDYQVTDTITLTSVSAYAHKHLDYAQDLDGTESSDGQIQPSGDIRAFNQELRVSLNSSVIHAIAGAAYDNVKASQFIPYQYVDASLNQPIPGLAPIVGNENVNHSSLNSYAIFANSEYNIRSNLSISAGVRYTQTNQRASYCDIDQSPGYTGNAIFNIFQNVITGSPQPPIGPGQCYEFGDGLNGTILGKSILTPFSRTLKEHNVSFKAGISYKLANGGLLYANVSQGYKAGVFSAIGASAVGQYAPAQQEKVVVYEGGMKIPLFDHKVQFNGAVFYDDYSDKQVRGRILDPIFGLLEKMINVPKSRIWGLEAELVVKPLSGLTLSGSGTYLNAKVTSDYSRTPDGSAVYNSQGYTGNFKGARLPFTPAFSANADAQYEWRVRDRLLAFVGGSMQYQAGENTTFASGSLPANDFKIKGYATFDLRAGLGGSDRNWQISVFGRNILNKYYITAITNYFDTRTTFSGRPASYGVSFNYKFL